MTQQVLWLTPEPPGFDRSGGSIRQAHLLAAVAERADVHLRLIGELEDDSVRDRCTSVIEVPVPPAPSLPRLARYARFASSRQPDELRRASRHRTALSSRVDGMADADVVVVEHASLGPLGLPSGPRTILDLHYLPSVKAGHHEAISRSRRERFFWGVEHRRARRLEQGLVARYDEVVVCSPADAEAIGGAARVVPNGVDSNRIRLTQIPATPTVLFLGRLGYEPNVDAVRWLVDIVAHLRQLVPAVDVTVAGRSPHPDIHVAARAGSFHVRADVPDVRPLLEAARVLVVPVRVGSGTRLKVLEGWAAGRPVVGTSIGLDGLSVRDGVDALVADTPAAFAEKIGAVLTDDALAQRLGNAGRARAEAADWTSIADRWADIVLGADS